VFVTQSAQETTMGQLNIDMFITLDGVIQAPGGPDEDREDGFEHGGWQAPYFDEESGRVVTEQIERIDALLLGRKTYEIFAAYWPNAPAGDPIASKLNNAPKYVASHTLTTLEWNNSHLLQGDVATAVSRLKRDHDEIHTIGSGDLAQTLLRHDLADRLNLWVYPLLLGTGKHLFADGTTPTALRLTNSTTFPGGGVLLTYERTGKPTYGTLGQPAD
jgi:dihydrofolate reductase